MEEHQSTAGQGLGVAGLVLGILAIPMGIIPCTFYIGIIFGIIGLVLSLVALSQANRGHGPRNLIIAALICSIVGLTFASVWGFTLSRNGAKFIKEVIRDGIHNGTFDAKDAGDFESDTAVFEDHTSSDLQDMTDSLKILEGENKNP
jgi:hypothetical protein